MQVNNKTLIVIIVAVIVLLWYVKSARSEVSRYKNIIDTYMSEDSNNKKSSMKKVRFNLPNNK